MWRSASASCAAQDEACQGGREEPSAGAPAVQREMHRRGHEDPSAEQGDGNPMHWLTLVFSDPEEEMFFRRNTLVANKTLILAVGGTGLSCFVLLWAAAARNGPHLTHALWTPWFFWCTDGDPDVSMCCRQRRDGKPAGRGKFSES